MVSYKMWEEHLKGNLYNIASLDEQLQGWTRFTWKIFDSYWTGLRHSLVCLHVTLHPKEHFHIRCKPVFERKQSSNEKNSHSIVRALCDESQNGTKFQLSHQSAVILSRVKVVLKAWWIPKVPVNAIVGHNFLSLRISTLARSFDKAFV